MALSEKSLHAWDMKDTQYSNVLSAGFECGELATHNFITDNPDRAVVDPIDKTKPE